MHDNARRAQGRGDSAGEPLHRGVRDGPMNSVGVFAPLRERNFRRYAAARVVNMSGITMAGVALAFAVLDEDDSSFALGQVLAASQHPAGGVPARRGCDRGSLRPGPGDAGLQHRGRTGAGNPRAPGDHRQRRALALPGAGRGERDAVGSDVPCDGRGAAAAGAARSAAAGQRADVHGPRIARRPRSDRRRRTRRHRGPGLGARRRRVGLAGLGGDPDRRPRAGAGRRGAHRLRRRAAGGLVAVPRAPPGCG